MDGYWPSSFFCVFMDRDKAQIHEQTEKKGLAILPEQAWTIEDLLQGERSSAPGKCFSQSAAARR